MEATKHDATLTEIKEMVKLAEKHEALGDYTEAKHFYGSAAEILIAVKKSLDKSDPKRKKYVSLAYSVISKGEEMGKKELERESCLPKKDKKANDDKLHKKEKLVDKQPEKPSKISIPNDKPKPEVKVKPKSGGKVWVNPAKAKKEESKLHEEEKKVEEEEKKNVKAKKPAVPSRAGVVKKPVPKAVGPKVNAGRKATGQKSEKPPSTVPKDILEQLEGCIIPREKWSITLDSIKGQSDIKQAVQENIILPLKNPKIFTGIRAPSRAILLYGPPGNGKTLLAKALAHEVKRTFFNVSASSLMSKWVGEGERLMKGLFTLAEERGPSIIFFDEIDSLLTERKSSENGASLRMKTEFLVQIDGVGSDTSGNILVLGATNRPFDLDAAAMRRFAKRIYVGLPDYEARMAILESLLAGEKCELLQEEFEDVVNRLDGYSSSDLSYYCKEVAMIPLSEHSIEKLEKIQPDEIRSITYDDFLTAMRKVRPSYSKDVWQEFIDWENSLALA